MKRYYKTMIKSQKQIKTKWELTFSGKIKEIGICPFCETENIGLHKDEIKAGYIEPLSTCKHFKDYIMGDKMSITILFEGWVN